jgi:hypothetical protein
MNKIIIILVVIGIVSLMHSNLPPDDISGHLYLGNNTGGFTEIAAKLATSQFIANWEYLNLFIIKFAYSERLGMVMYALPFGKWELLGRTDELKSKIKNIIRSNYGQMGNGN